MRSNSQRIGPRDDAAEVVRLVEDLKATADKLLRDGADRGDVKLLSRSLRELRYCLKILAKYRNRRKVTVFGSARTPPDSPVFQQAVDFGRQIAEAGYMVITGGGPGIMEAGHVGAGVDMSIGFNILLPFEQSANPVIAQDEKSLHLNYFFTRKVLFLKESDAVVLFPGGFGTLDEGFESLTMMQTGKCPIIPLVMVDVPGGDYWESWLDYVTKCLYKPGLISDEDFSLFRITHSVEEAVEEIARFYRVFHSDRYVRGKLSLRLKNELSEELLEKIREGFGDIVTEGSFVQGPAHDDEKNEPDVRDLPRLSFAFNRKAHGRLRQLINLINDEGSAV